MKDKIGDLIQSANQRLKNGGISIRLERSGNTLYLRGTLPPKPGDKHPNNHQQRIPLSRLSIYANPAGIREAEKEAQKVSGLLARKEFTWEPYLRAQIQPTTIGDWITRFEQDYFSRRGRTPKAQTTWETDYLAVFKRLPAQAGLTGDLLEQVVRETPPDTRTRRRWVLACQKLANFAGLTIDLKPLRGNYSHRSVGERTLPTDLQIMHWREQIQNPEWRWVYGILATYGLRPHEVFHLEWSVFPQLRVKDGKTGSRLVHPLYPEWVEQWSLQQGMPPACTGANNRDLGQRVTQAFRRAKIPFSAYALRHCWAIRAIQFNLPIAIAARMMGHSVEVHTQTYHRWMNDDQYRQSYDRVCRAPDRPTPPVRHLVLTKS